MSAHLIGCLMLGGFFLILLAFATSSLVMSVGWRITALAYTALIIAGVYVYVAINLLFK